MIHQLKFESKMGRTRNEAKLVSFIMKFSIKIFHVMVKIVNDSDSLWI